MVMTQEQVQNPTRTRTGLRTFVDAGGRMTTGAVVALVVAWVAAIGVLEAIAPTADPNAVLSAWEISLSVLYTFAIMGAAVGLLSRVRFGAMASILGGGVMVAGSVTCWMGGHIGSWIMAQFVAGLAIAGLSAVFLQRT